MQRNFFCRLCKRSIISFLLRQKSVLNGIFLSFLEISVLACFTILCSLFTWIHNLLKFYFCKYRHILRWMCWTALLMRKKYEQKFVTKTKKSIAKYLWPKVADLDPLFLQRLECMRYVTIYNWYRIYKFMSTCTSMAIYMLPMPLTPFRRC